MMVGIWPESSAYISLYSETCEACILNHLLHIANRRVTTETNMADSPKIVAVAGATGQLGSLIALELRQRDAKVIALVRPGTSPSRTRTLTDAGVEVVEVDLSDVPALTKALTGVSTLVSALQGLKDIIHGAQGNLVQAATAAGVDRFIPSDFSLDFTKTDAGSNRNLDLRREFHTTLNESGLTWTSILNGAFMDVVTTRQMPMINDSWNKIMHFGNADQELDVTTIPNTAAYTACVALDPRPTPKFLRIAGDTFTPKTLASTMTKVSGQEFSTLWMGPVGLLRGIITVLRYVMGGEEQVFPIWQGMQYMENMVSGRGKLEPLDNDRYPGLKWTSVEEALREAQGRKSKSA